MISLEKSSYSKDDFDDHMHEKWRQSELVVDGVVVNGIENDNVLVLSCEMDPPGGWITRRINIFHGKEMY